MLGINEVLQGRYRIVRQLGQGGMGAVYEAYDERVGAAVALKEILVDLTKITNSKQQEMVRRAFEREKTSLAKVKHEAFPRIIDYFLESNNQYIVMELINGDDLGELLEKNQKPFTVAEVLNWTDQLLDALDYLHTLAPPIIHRDIKPQNLKLTSRQKVKLLDFGIAKGDDNTQANSTVTNQTFIAATLHYSPLEQILRVLDPTFQEVIAQRYDAKSEAVMQQNADARSDLYALGATLYHLLTGNLPIDALKRSLDIWSGKPDPLPSPISLNSNISPEISDCLLKAMEIERDSRYSTAMEMQAALKDAGEADKRREEQSRRQAWQAEQARLEEERRRVEQERRMQAQQAETQRQQQAQVNAERLRQAEERAVQAERKLSNSQPPPAATQAVISQDQIGYNQFAPGVNTGGQQYNPTNAPTEQFNLSDINTAATEQFTNVNTGGDQATLPRQQQAVNFEIAAPASTPPKKSRALFFILPILGLLALFGGVFGMWFMLGGSSDDAANVNKPANNSAVVTTNSSPAPSNKAADGNMTVVKASPEPSVTLTPRPEETPKPNTVSTPPPRETVAQQPPPPRQQPPPKQQPPKQKKTVTADDIMKDN